jgi:hypothetical protein
MSDNVTLPGAGTVAATDNIGGAHFQRVKLIHGGDGINEGDVATGNGLPVSPATGAQFIVEPLGIPGEPRTLSAGSTSANTALTSTCRRVSILALTADICFLVGSSSQTATTSSHYIMAGERMDIALPATPNIAVIRAGAADGTLRVTELV